MFLEGPVGRLDARLHGPDGGRPVLVLHPHPLFGGTMGSRMVYDLAQHLSGAGRQVLRFDYRGVGRSDGAYGRGVGETEDATAAFQWLEKHAGQPPSVVGYSFGGAVACHLATQIQMPLLVPLATPAALRDAALDPVADAARTRAARVHLVASEDDALAPVEGTLRLQRAFPSAGLDLLPRSGHFLEPSQTGAACRAVERILQ